MKYLLHTNACVRFFNGSHPALVSRVLATPPVDLAVSAMSVGELCFGAARSTRAKANLERVRAFVAEVAVLPFEVDAANRFGALKAGLVSRGRRIGDFDVAIAAVALTGGLTLVTSDADFDRIPELRREDWSIAEGD